MEYDYLVKLRSHPAWRLLTADNAPLIIGFFHHAFIRPNRRSMAAGELAARLDDYLYHLRTIHGESRFPRAPAEYLDAWASGEQAYLRKYYPEKGDEPEYDLTPASEKVIEWLSSLAQKTFVGTESRLMTVFRLLREIVSESATDPDEQIEMLEKKKAGIDAEIARLRRGRMQPRSRTRIRERYLQAEETARRLLFDFRQIEENFRRLDRKTRRKIATSPLPKGKLLDEIFGKEDAIRDSDQGKSFQAFWTFLMSPASQEELDGLLNRVRALPEVEGLAADGGLERIRFRLLDAGEKVNATCSLIVEQLRKFLDSQAWLENRRIMELIKSIEQRAVRLGPRAPNDNAFAAVNDTRPDLNLPMSRGLFRPSRRPVVDDAPEHGRAVFDSAALFRQHYVDRRLLKSRIRKALRGRSQISLEELCERYPVEKGLSEVVAYLDIACRDTRAVVDTETTRTVSWREPGGTRRRVRMPAVIFT